MRSGVMRTTSQTISNLVPQCQVQAVCGNHIGYRCGRDMGDRSNGSAGASPFQSTPNRLGVKKAVSRGDVHDAQRACRRLQMSKEKQGNLAIVNLQAYNAG